MKKLYNVIFPMWLILIVPPIILVTLPSNFIIDSLVLITGLKLFKINNWFDKYKSSIIKVWVIGFIVDILGSLLLLFTQFMGNNEFLYENLVYPVAWNPFESIIAFLYVLIVVLLCGILIYLINYKFSFKKTDLNNKSKKTISLLLGIITAPYLFFLPTSYLYKSDITTLEDYQDSYIGDNSAVGNIINKIYSGKYLKEFSLDTKKEPYGVIIDYEEDVYGDVYKYLEEDALILFKLIKNIDYVKFNVDNKTYIFDIDYINKIYENIKEISLDDITSRYKTDYFTDFTYFGHIDKYDIFDTSSICGNDKNLLYTDSVYNYYIRCSSINTLYLVNGNKKTKLKTALEKEEINVADLFNTNIKISKETLNEIDN